MFHVDIARGLRIAAVILLAVPELTHAQTGRQELSIANQFFREGNLREAVKYYRQALSAVPASQEKERERCHDQLLVILPRLGRCDEAIAIGTAYAAQLAKAGKEPHRRAVLTRLGVCYLALGHRNEARRRFEDALRDEPPGIDPLVAIEARARLARLTQADDAEEHWETVRRQAKALLIKSRDSLTVPQRAACIRMLAESQRVLGDPAAAIARLKDLAADPDHRKNHAELCETLRLLAGHRIALAAKSATADGVWLAAEHDLRQALAAYDQIAAPDPVRRADLLAELASVLDRRGEDRNAAELREKAAALYVKGLAEFDPQQTDRQSPAAAFWKLHQLYQHAELYQQVLLLADGALRSRPVRKTPLEQSRLRAERGVIRLYRDAVAIAGKILEPAANELAKERPMNLIELPRVLTILAIVELRSADVTVPDDGHVARAAELAQRVRRLYEDHALPADAVLVETSRILGVCATWHGDDRKGLATYRAGAELCGKLDHVGPQRCNLLLHSALVHRARNEFAEARKACQEAMDSCRSMGGKSAENRLGYACFLCATAGMDADACIAADTVGLARFHALAKDGERLGRLCAEYRIKEGPLLQTALHCQALARLGHKDFAAADTLWRALANAQRQAVIAMPDDPRCDPLLPQTLTWLGLTAELQGKADAAEKLYAEALRLQSGVRAASPTHYTTLWRLAGLRDRRGEHKQSRELLEQALAVAESVRVPADLQRFHETCERLVEQCVRDGKLSDALVYSARSRSRALTDQLRLAGVDHDGSSKHRRDRADALERITHRMRVAAPLLMADTGSAEIGRLRGELEAAQKEYADLRREIETHSKAYAALTVGASLPESLRKHVLQPGRPILAYHIGAERSYLMLLSDRSERPEVWPLTVPTRVLGAIGRAKRAPAAGLLRALDAPSAAAVTGANGAPARLLDRWTLRRLIAHHRRQIADPEFTTRGLRLSWDSAVAAPGEVMEQIAESIVPRAMRVRLKQLGARQVIVVPDGALHQLPLESLVVRAGSAPRYVLDELPPIIYAPSLSILAHLAEHRPPRAMVDSPALLSVYDPAYPQRDGQTPLPATAEESQRIRARFDPARVMALEGKAATEEAVRKNIKDRQIVHLAVCGRSAPSHGGLYLVPGGADDDGVLTLAKIYRLPLGECDLAVLSACETDSDAPQPLEAGATLANAFLMAGAAHVIASHWRSADSSTTELLARFFDEAIPADGKRVSYAQALHNARKKLRDSADRSAPVNWAAPVLIGTGDMLDPEPPVAEHAPAVADPASSEPEWYASPWLIPSVAIAGAVLALLAVLGIMARRRRDEYRMPGI